MVAAAAALMLFRLIKQPPILGYLLAGVLVGPFALQGRFVQDTDTVSLVADVGLVVLLFSIGVEFGWERIRKVGLRVVVIGAVEIAAMISIGYYLGRALGWSSTTSIYLGAALAFSSSAVLVQTLRSSGQLMSLRGQMVVGILVVEDFVAVVLLAVFAGYASHETSGQIEVWPIVIKMSMFAIGALVFGTLLAPRFMDLLDRVNTRETWLIGSLGICFGVGLLAREMGLSAGAGAFLIGTVLGDTKHRDQVTRLIAPVRDLFAALFFVSIGMLVNMSEIPQFLGTALIATGALILGKMIAVTIGTFLTGHDGDTSLEVGASMPQLGEFSLAIARSGSEHASVGSQLYPVVTISTLLSSSLYPLVFKSHSLIVLGISRLTPDRVKTEAANFTQRIATARRAMAPSKPTPEIVIRGIRTSAVSFGIIGLVIVAGALIANVGTGIAEELGLPSNLVAVAVLAAVVTLMVPAAIVLWHILAQLAAYLSRRAFIRFNFTENLQAADVASALLVTILLLAIAIRSMSALLELMAVENITAPVPALVMVITCALTATLAMKIHSQLDRTFRRTLLGDSETTGAAAD